MLRVLVVFVAWSLVACGGDAPGTPGEVDGGSVSEAAAPILPPQAPAAPDFSPCPPGWIDGTDGAGVPTCLPWDSLTAPTCPPGEIRTPGEAACMPVGRPCPEGPFGDAVDDHDLPLASGAVAYVDPSGPPGDGTRDAPFASITTALRASARRLHLARGTYNEDVVVTADVDLLGACTSEVVLNGFVSFTTGHGDLRSTNPSLVRDVTFRGGLSLEGRLVHLDRIHISRDAASEHYAHFSVSGDSSVLLRRSDVDVDVTVTGGPLRVERSRLRRTIATARASARLVLADSIIDSAVPWRQCLVASRGSVQARHVIARGCAGILLINPDEVPSASNRPVGLLEDLVLVADASSFPEGGAAIGVILGDLHGSRIQVINVPTTGVVLSNAEAALTDLRIARDVGDPLAVGIGAQEGSSLRLERAQIDLGGQGAVVAIASQVRLRDVDIGAETREQLGLGFVAQRGAEASIDRLRSVGGSVLAIQSEVRASDLSVTNPRAFNLDIAYGLGGHNAQLDVERAALLGGTGFGALLLDDAQLVARDLLVDGTALADCTDCASRFGIGVAAFTTARVDLARVLVTRPALCGVYVESFPGLAIIGGRIEHAPVGLCGEGASAAAPGLSAEVRLVNTILGVDSTMLPVPGRPRDLQATTVPVGG